MKFNITYSLDEIAEIYDGPHATPTKLEEGNAIFLSISSIDNGRLNLDKSSFISEDDFVKWTRRVTPQAGDVVFSYETKIGEASIIPEGLRCCLGRRMGLLRAKQDKVLPQYLLYAYLSPAFQDVIREKTIHGSTTDRISIKEIPSFEIQLPDIHTQRKVIQILSSIDNKLSKNAEINQTLEQIAQALFKSWFIDFEPVKAKIMTLEAGGSQEEAMLAAMAAISGKDADSLAIFEQEHPEKYAELRGTAELFPSAMQKSELGEIPKGWAIDNLGKIIEFNPKRILKKGINAPYLDMKNVPVKGHSVQDVVCREVTSGTKFKNGDTLLARITPCLENGKTAFVDFLSSNETVGWGSTEFIVMRVKRDLPLSLSYFIARLESFRTKAIQSMQGTSGRQRADAAVLQNMPWIIPPDALLAKFGEFSNVVIDNNRIKHNQNAQLSQLRDTLLPKLLSGEITLPEAEEIAKEAEYV